MRKLLRRVQYPSSNLNLIHTVLQCLEKFSNSTFNFARPPLRIPCLSIRVYMTSIPTCLMYE